MPSHHFTDEKNPFTEKNPDFEKRKTESAHIISKHSDRKPIIAYTDDEKFIDKMEKYKYLVPEDTTIAQFMTVLRKKIDLNKEEALYLYVKNGQVIIPTVNTVGGVYNEFANEDGFLYVKFVGENTFG